MLAATAATANCRQALALALDVSGSVDAAEYRLQLDGLAGALASADVQTALLAMPSAPVSLAIYEWSGPDDQRLLQDWISVVDTPTIDQIVTRLRTTYRKHGNPGTALGTAISFGTNLLHQKSDCWKQTLDISGDGKSNMGPHPQDISRVAGQSDIVVNGLVIGADAPKIGDARQVDIAELSSYFRAYVIVGTDSFVETALGFDAFEEAMTRKLLRELEGLVLSRL
ncbi:MAG: DUF1194 domain-containing protein [Paracoccaceae bacterium]